MSPCFFGIEINTGSRHKCEHNRCIALNYLRFRHPYSPLRREGRMLSAGPVCSCALSLCTLQHETAGAARTRSSLRPLFRGLRKFPAKLGHHRTREREGVSVLQFEILSSFRDAPLGAGPESILPIVLIDSGFVLRTPRNDGGFRVCKGALAPCPPLSCANAIGMVGTLALCPSCEATNYPSRTSSTPTLPKRCG